MVPPFPPESSPRAHTPSPVVLRIGANPGSNVSPQILLPLDLLVSSLNTKVVLSPAYALRILEMRERKPYSAIRFHYLKPARLPSGALKEVISRIFKKHKRAISSVNYVFCSDQYLLQINQEYLNHDFYTDIITFELSNRGDDLVADVYISIDRVKENAAQLGSPVFKELIRVALHGALHLVGFKDKSQAEKKRMRTEEDRYLSKVLKNVPRETKEKKRFHVKHGRRVS